MSIAPLASIGAARPAEGSPSSILLIEDDPGDAVLVQACLFEMGVADAAVTWVRSLTEARQVVASVRPGCVLLDLGLPDAFGYAAIQSMVEVVPDAPVIVLTGRQERDGVAALGAGAQDYLIKDAITGELLERSIRYAVERKRAEQSAARLRLSAAERQRLERGLLPTPVLRSDAVTCTTYYRPGCDDALLGGDFFDVVETPDGRVRAVIGDVMGHGPDEAALGVHLRVAWRTLLLAGVPDDQLLPNLAALLGTEQTEHVRFVTVCDVTVDGDRLSVRVAGHPAPILGRAGAATYPELRVGPPLGVRMPRSARLGAVEPWPANQLSLSPGTSVVLYTDGLLEAYQTDPGSAGIGIGELTASVGAFLGSGRPPGQWLPDLVAGAPVASVDDTAAVVLTTGPQGP